MSLEEAKPSLGQHWANKDFEDRRRGVMIGDALTKDSSEPSSPSE